MLAKPWSAVLCGCEKKGTAGAFGVRRLRRRFVISNIDEQIIVAEGHYPRNSDWKGVPDAIF